MAKSKQMRTEKDYYNLIVLGVPLPFEPDKEVPYPEGWVSVDEKTGCHFWNNKLIHTEDCACGWEFDEQRDLNL